MILVTGSSGFLGRTIAQSFLEEAVCISKTAKANQSGRNIAFDLTKNDDTDTLAEQLKKHKITRVIHTAAVTPWSSNPDFSQDLEMAKTIADICEKLHVEQLYFFSGWNVYSMKDPAPYNESAPLSPDSDYGRSKLKVENYFKRSLPNTKFINLRLASVYGPGQTSAGLIPNLTKSAVQEKQLTINALETRRDYLYIDDLMKTLHQLTDIYLEDNTDLNIGSGASMSVGAVAETIQAVYRELYNKEAPIKTAEKIKESALADNRLDISKARDLGLLENPTTLREGLEKYMTWVKHENIF